MNRGAFVVYKEPIERLEQRNPVMVSNERNMNKRMIAFLRALPSTTDNKPKSLEKDRCFGHMVCERLRREKEKQNYAALHPLLPAGTKIDKISIVQMATLQLQDLQNVKEELRKQNYELEKKLCVKEEEKINVAKITLQVKGPSSSMDSMIGVLRCLKSMGLKASTISSLFSTDELSAAMDIETKVESCSTNFIFFFVVSSFCLDGGDVLRYIVPHRAHIHSLAHQNITSWGISIIAGLEIEPQILIGWRSRDVGIWFLLLYHLWSGLDPTFYYLLKFGSFLTQVKL